MMKCEKCGTEMMHYIKGASQITKCPKCGWGWATSYIEPIHEDTTIYSIIIEHDNDVNEKNVSEIKKYTNQTSPEIISVLKNGNFILTKQNAIEVKNIICELDNLNIKYNIEPEFKWKTKI